MRIALASLEFKDGDLSHNKEALFFGIRKAAAEECQMVLFGEAFLQGFSALNWDYAHDLGVALPLEAPDIQEIARFAAEKDIAVGFGFIENFHNDLYCSYLVIAKTGMPLDVFRRVSVGWKEFFHTDSHYREGERFHTFEYGNLTFAVALCGDLWEDDNVRALRALTKDIVLWPSYLNYSSAQWTREKPAFVARAALTGAPTLFINSHSKKPSAIGGAFLFDQGQIREELPPGKKDLLIIDIK